MVNYGDLQFPERIMVARRSEMSAEWKVRFAISIASVAIQAFTKLLFSFSDVVKYDVHTHQMHTQIQQHTYRRRIHHILQSGMIKAYRKGKASGLENLRPYHGMESMRKSNILS
jgi:hypothetical protein